MTRKDLVEIALGYRVIPMSKVATRGDQPGHSTFQLQVLADNNGVFKVARVRPASRQEYEMFQMLCTPEAEWGRRDVA